jgi:ribokinase
VILVAGSANVDFVVRANHIPRPGETVLGQSFQTFAGGKGANQAVACSRAGGASTQLLAALGADAHASVIEASVKAAKVELLPVRVANVATGAAFICVSDDGENAITVAPGANAYLLPHHLPDLKEISHLLLQLETPLDTIIAFVQAAKKQGVQIVLNAAPAQALPDELLRMVDILIVNEGELMALANETRSVELALEKLPCQSVVVTLGSKGCLARHKGTLYQQAAFPIKALDTTAAGDTFCGVLVAQLSQGPDWPVALRVANAASALTCLTLGAQSSIPTALEVAQFLENH